MKPLALFLSTHIHILIHIHIHDPYPYPYPSSGVLLNTESTLGCSRSIPPCVYISLSLDNTGQRSCNQEHSSLDRCTASKEDGWLRGNALRTRPMEIPARFLGQVLD